jgi:hypothetical protein
MQNFRGRRASWRRRRAPRHPACHPLRRDWCREFGDVVRAVVIRILAAHEREARRDAGIRFPSVPREAAQAVAEWIVRNLQ